MFLLSNEVMLELVTAKHIPCEGEITAALWNRFCEEADVSIVSKSGAWTTTDAASKAKARLHELESGTYEFILNSDLHPSQRLIRLWIPCQSIRYRCWW